MLVRAFCPDDVAFATHLADLEGWGNAAADLRNMLALEPHGCLIAEDGGQPVGMATTIAYGKLGWIGNLIVKRDCRGQGYGRTLLQRAIAHLFDCGVRTVGLDATPETVELYKSVGFWPAFDTLHLRRPALPAPAPVGDSLVPLEARGLHTVAMFDWALFGSRRQRVLRALLALSPVAYVAQDEAGVAGYLLARRAGPQWVLGPWVCVRSAESLLTRALAAIGAEPAWVGVPAVNEQGLQLLETHGFAPCGREVRMYYGDWEGIGQPQHIYGIASPEKG